MSSDTLVYPAKATGQNEMPFGRMTYGVPSNTALERGPGPPWEEKIWGSHSKPKFAAMLPIARLLLALIQNKRSRL